MKKIGLVAVLAVLTLIATTTIVQADPWSAVDSGYAVSTNYHGQEIDITSPPTDLFAKVGIRTSVLAKFGLTLDYVYVELRDPNGDVVDDDIVGDQPGELNLSPPYSPKGNEIWYGETDHLAPSTWVIGDYSVKAYFYAPGGKEIANTDDLVAMRATTVMVVPEVPIGTLSILLTMLASLAIFARKKF